MHYMNHVLQVMLQCITRYIDW